MELRYRAPLDDHARDTPIRIHVIGEAPSCHQQRGSLDIFMAALCNRAGHSILPCGFFFPSSFIFSFSAPNLSRRTLDVYRTSTHGVALVRI